MRCWSRHSWPPTLIMPYIPPPPRPAVPCQSHLLQSKRRCRIHSVGQVPCQAHGASCRSSCCPDRNPNHCQTRPEETGGQGCRQCQGTALRPYPVSSAQKEPHRLDVVRADEDEVGVKGKPNRQDAKAEKSRHRSSPSRKPNESWSGLRTRAPFAWATC
jgi:hypothetical protein